ncbi:hypothetical protein QN362_11085 [Actimicrobium sp. CCC2.4]|uniref:hypothetical protein n=1 Tax=Actimicrobium sp. CCC2.4 TaxID=3048606 RepID=UPI002AC9B5F3|nr:hypothetical protein [Actimicrobium sp. CCC2.4]MEB0135872.1 hypothetical protein [Actimicrobium sp. CCC2.4]WPX33348.1 hypothetical protein RHM62_05790 [Actimicrobium sp. CCC2.4]
MAKQEVISKDNTLNDDPARNIALDDRPGNAASQMIVIPIGVSQSRFSEAGPASLSSIAQKKQNPVAAWVSRKLSNVFH